MKFKYKKQLQKYASAIVAISIFSIAGVAFLVMSQATTGVRLYIAPGETSLVSGSNVTITVHEDSLTDPVNSVQAAITYDPAQLQLVGLAESGPFSLVAATSTSTPGLVLVARSIPAGGGSVTGDNPIIALNFKVIGLSGSTTINFDATSSFVVRTADNTNILTDALPGVTYAISNTMSPPPPSSTTDDTVSPSVPGNLRVASIKGGRGVQLKWDASSDNVGVAGYHIYRNNIRLAGVTTTSYTDTTVAKNVSYTYTVAAYDTSNNSSELSTSAVVQSRGK